MVRDDFMHPGAVTRKRNNEGSSPLAATHQFGERSNRKERRREKKRKKEEKRKRKGEREHFLITTM